MARNYGGKSKGKGKEKVKISRSRDVYIPLLKGRRPGGPVCDLLHISYDAHVARNVWRYGSRENFYDRGVLKMHQRLGALEKWEVDEREPWWRIVEASGLEHMRTCLHTNIDAALISAFVERWCPETNSFHMTWGEMPITLHDVWHILRLNIDGNEVGLDRTSTNKKTALQEKKEQAEFLNIDVSELVFEMDRGSIKFETLREAGDALEGDEECATAYLLYLVSATIFQEKSVDRAKHKFLPLFIDVDNVFEYAWGKTL